MQSQSLAAQKGADHVDLVLAVAKDDGVGWRERLEHAQQVAGHAHGGVGGGRAGAPPPRPCALPAARLAALTSLMKALAARSTRGARVAE